MEAKDIPPELMEILDKAAGKIHSKEGRVATNGTSGVHQQETGS